MPRYRVQRVWTVDMESWCEVDADDSEQAKQLALEVDDYDDQRIMDNSDGPTEIGDVEELEERYVFSPDPELLKILKGGGK